MKFGIVVLVGFAVLLIISLVLQNRKNRAISHNSKYTIGEITEITPVHKNQVKVVYQYSYLHQLYSGFLLCRNNEINIKRFYAIRFLPDNPKTSQLIIKNEFYARPDYTPAEGWDQMPR